MHFFASVFLPKTLFILYINNAKINESSIFTLSINFIFFFSGGKCLLCVFSRKVKLTEAIEKALALSLRVLCQVSLWPLASYLTLDKAITLKLYPLHFRIWNPVTTKVHFSLTIS